MKENVKHNHHYLPQFYLKYWADDKNKVWIYRLHRSNVNRQPEKVLCHISKVCSEEKLYSIGDDISIEDWADRNIEYHCAPTFKKIICRKEIDDKDIFYTKSFLALTMARHPLLKNSSEVVFNFYTKTNLALELNSHLLSRNLIEKILNTFSQTIKPLNPLAQTTILRMNVNLRELDKLNLQILYIPDEVDAFFCTSDVPFFIVTDVVKEKFNDLEINHPKNTHVWFPISPKTLAFLSNVEKLPVYEEISDLDRIKNINNELRSRAMNIIIGNKSDIF